MVVSLAVNSIRLLSCLLFMLNYHLYTVAVHCNANKRSHCTNLIKDRFHWEISDAFNQPRLQSSAAHAGPCCVRLEIADCRCRWIRFYL